MTRGPSRATVAIAAILAVGVLLRTYQFTTLGSLWGDELSIALNVTERGWQDLLTSPLEYQQVAPIGFIAMEKLGVTLLGNTEAGLRLFPFLFSVVSLIAFWRISARYLEGVTQWAAISLFALSPALLWYTRNAKQYTGDVAVVLILLLLTLRFREKNQGAREIIVTGLVGGAALLFSLPGVLVAPGLVAVLVVERWRRGVSPKPVLMVGLFWLAGAAIASTTAHVSAPADTRAFMLESWQGAFLPLPWESWRNFFWFPRTMLAFFGFFIGLFRPDSIPEFLVAGIYGGLSILGLWWVGRHRGWAAALLLVPVVVAILASIGRILPLSGRVAIYMGPPLLLLSMAGMEQVREWFGGLPPRGTAHLVVLLGVAPALLLPFILAHVNHRQPARLVLDQVATEWRDGDVLYALYGANMAMRFYGEPRGISPWIAGKRHGTETRAYLREVDELRGRPRAWFFFTGSLRCDSFVIRSYLKSIGTELERIPDPYGNEGRYEAAAYLYALDEPVQWGRASAHTYDLPNTSSRACIKEEGGRERYIRQRLRGWIERAAP